MIFVSGAVAALLLFGCLPGMSKRERLTEAVREFNDGVRWGKYELSVMHLAVADRRRFADRHTALADELEIADYEVQRIDVDSKTDTAEVLVDISWSLKHRGLLERTQVAQKWEERLGQWVMVKEERRSGAPMSLFDERPRAAAQ